MNICVYRYIYISAKFIRGYKHIIRCTLVYAFMTMYM